MSSERQCFVVDASVGIKLFIEEPLSDAAHAFFARLTTDTPVELHVPDLFYFECAIVYQKYVRRCGLPIEDARADLADLKALALKSTPTATLLPEALTVAHQKNLTAYDACYAVLAQVLGGRLRQRMIAWLRRWMARFGWGIFLKNHGILLEKYLLFTLTLATIK